MTTNSKNEWLIDTLNDIEFIIFNIEIDIEIFSEMNNISVLDTVEKFIDLGMDIIYGNGNILLRVENKNEYFRYLDFISGGINDRKRI